MKTFGTFSSLNASIEKCEVCWIGQSRFRKDKPVKCKLTFLVTSSIKILGVRFSYKKEIADDNFFRSTELHAVGTKHLASALSDLGWKDSSI